ncbi:MAG: type II toxin-antitoxin system RelE/ParE family toxin [Deltaproteobacteria bacterium]|nr:type II toxin-antitoxin system RelE/ParE family toxin [Deltaproteobacteria bacterium]
MKYSAHLAEDAENDLFDIFRYVAEEDSPAKAEKLINNIEAVCNKLADLPEREHIPPELERIGIFSYREVHFKPYRIIYQILEKEVFIHCILDGRRDMEEILHHRMLR